MNDAFKHRFWRESEGHDGPLLSQSLLHCLVGVAVMAVCRVNIFLVHGEGVAAEVALNGAGFNQADMDIAAVKLQAEGVTEPLQCVFTGVIGTTIGEGDKARTELF